MKANMKIYAIDQLQQTVCANHNGHAEPMEFWTRVLTVRVARSSNALRKADVKWPGKRHRARLLRTEDAK